MASMIFTPALDTRNAVHEHLARTLLVLRGRPYAFDDDKGLGHAEPYGECDQAWDDAAELIDAVTTQAEIDGLTLTLPEIYQRSITDELDHVTFAGKRAAKRAETLRAKLAEAEAEAETLRVAYRTARQYIDASCL